MTVQGAQFVTDVQLWNGLARVFGTPLPLAGGAVAALAEAAGPAAEASCFDVALAGGGAVVFALVEFPFAKVARTELTMAEVRALPEGLAQGLTLGAVHAVQEVLPESLGAEVTGVTPCTSHVLCEVWLDVQVDLGGGAIVLGQIGGTRAQITQAMARLFPQAAGQLPAYPAVIAQDVPVDLRVSFGGFSMSADDVFDLEAGDIILAQVDPAQRRILISGAGMAMTAVMAAAEDGGSVWSVKEISMANDEVTGAAAAQAGEALGEPEVSLCDIPIALQFAGTRRSVSLAELQAMTPGSLIPFEITEPEAGLPVSILANGAAIGSGHLVQVDGAYAVRVARLQKRGDSAT